MRQKRDLLITRTFLVVHYPFPNLPGGPEQKALQRPLVRLMLHERALKVFEHVVVVIERVEEFILVRVLSKLEMDLC